MFHWISTYFVSLWDTIFGSLLFTLSSQQQSGRLLVLGLDNAGKTTLLQAIRLQSSGGNSPTDSTTNNTNMNMQQQQIRSYPPTDRPEYMKNIVTINHQISFNAYDLGGHEAVRHLWSDYYHHDTTSSIIGDGDGSTTTTTSSSSSNTNLAILFCIDIADRGRLEEAAYELDALIYDGLLGSNGDIGGNGNGSKSDTTNNGSVDVYQQDQHQSQQSQSTKDGIPIAILLTKCDQMHSNYENGETTIVSLMTIDEVCNGIEYNKLQNDYNGPIQIFCISVYEQKGYIEALQWITNVLIKQQQQKKK